MDLSFRPLLPDREAAIAATDLAVLMAAAAAVQAASVTARVQAMLDAQLTASAAADRFAPAAGSFDVAVAEALGRWRSG